MKEIKHLVTDKHELDDRDESILGRILGIFRKSEFRYKIFELVFHLVTLLQDENFPLGSSLKKPSR